MFDIGFSEVLLIFVIALIVLGPEKLPRAASQVGRWIGRARTMARQFKDQLEEEVNLENVRKAHKDAAAKEEAAAKDAPPPTGETAAGPTSPDPVDFRADTFSHAHATNEYGANPATANGGPPEESPSAGAADGVPVSTTPASTSESGASSTSAPLTAEVGSSSDNTHRTDSAEAYAPATTLTPTLPTSEPVHEPAASVTPAQQSDNHSHS
jgi:sec-independent protein translocase protein TatB